MFATVETTVSVEGEASVEYAWTKTDSYGSSNDTTDEREVTYPSQARGRRGCRGGAVASSSYQPTRACFYCVSLLVLRPFLGGLFLPFPPDGDARPVSNGPLQFHVRQGLRKGLALPGCAAQRQVLSGIRLDSGLAHQLITTNALSQANSLLCLFTTTPLPDSTCAHAGVLVFMFDNPPDGEGQSMWRRT
jgi:hypothetical protein